MKHLGKDGATSKPHTMRTICGRVVSTRDIVETSPDCETCHNAYLQALEDEQGEYESMCAEFTALVAD